MFRNKLLLIIPLACCITGLQAAHADSFDEMPIVLSANTLEQSRFQSPLTISIIDRQMIEASGARTIPDTLRLIPGMVVGHSANEFGDKPLLTVSYHGHSDIFSRQMNVLIDGRSIYDPLLGGVNWYNIPIALDDIERIEVTHGPNASTFGSNSFQAVVNIITRHASEDKGYFTKFNVGMHRIFDITSRYGGNNDDLDYSITLTTVNDDGQDRADGSDVFDDTHAGQLNYRIDYQINNRNKLTYTGGYGITDQNTEVTTRPDSQPKLPKRVIKDTTLHQLLRWDNTINSEQSFVVKYFYNYFHEADKFDSLPIDLEAEGVVGFDPLVLPINKTITSQSHNISFSHFINLKNTLDLVWGISLQNDQSESVHYLDPGFRESRNIYRLFGSLATDISRQHSIDLGVLLEKSDSMETDISPRFAYLYHLNHKHTFRLGISQAVRTPFIFEQSGQTFFTAELTIAGVGTGIVIILNDFFLLPLNNLKTEKITSVEFGYYGKYLQDRLLLNTRIFQDDLDDLIDAKKIAITPPPEGDFNSEAFIFNNNQATTVRGVEIEIDFKPKPGTRLFASLALLEITSNDNPQSVQSIDLEESAPDLSYSLLVMHDFNKNYSGSIGFYYVGDFSFTDVNNGSDFNGNIVNNRNLGGYKKLDLRLVRNFKLGEESISTAIVFQNLLGDYSDYDAIANSPEATVVQNRTIYIETKLRFR